MELVQLEGAHICSDGRLCTRDGQPTEWHVPDHGCDLLDDQDRIVGTVTHAGRIYDHTGRFIAEVARSDLHQGD